MSAIIQPMGSNTTTAHTYYSSPTPSPPHSPYNFYGGLTQTSYVWYPPVMDPTQQQPSFTQTSSFGKEMDAYSGPEDPPSSSASPNSQFLGLGSQAPSPSASASETRVNIPSVPAACLACRGKHLKCDGQSPCSRCTSANSECIYVASRRGYKGPRRGTAKNPNKRHASSPARESTSSAETPALLAANTVAPMSSSIPSSFNPGIVLPDNGASPFITSNSSPDANAQLGIYQHYPHGVDASSMVIHHHVPARVPVPTPGERCLDSFYHNFHAAHPFVMPKPYVLRIAKDGTLEPLLAAMRWVGSLYIDAGPSRQSFFEEAYRLAYEPGRPKDGFLVQAMLVLIIGLDGSCQQEKARELLVDVERIAVQIGLNTRPFASLNSRGMPVLEESWRRTWWDLYVVDGMIAGVHRTTNFLLYDVPVDVALPCEEYQFLSGHIPPPLSLEEMEDSDFLGDDREFSSFAYRIQCARNLGKFMRIPPIFGPEDENLSVIEALLTNWRLHLPDSKRDALHKDGQLDEMMFQAHMMHHATSILLHQPHSQLDSSATRPVNSCAPHAPVPSGDAFNAHTKHTIQSANEISKLVTHRVPLLSHSHFFACVVTLSSIVHLSKWALSYIPHNDDSLRQQIRLNIGALSKLAQVWGAAARAGGQVKGVAQEVYRVKKQQQLTPQYWLGLTQEEMMNSIAADESIISEIENLPAFPEMPNMLG